MKPEEKEEWLLVGVDGKRYFLRLFSVVAGEKRRREKPWFALLC